MTLDLDEHKKRMRRERRINLIVYPLGAVCIVGIILLIMVMPVAVDDTCCTDPRRADAVFGLFLTLGLGVMPFAILGGVLYGYHRRKKLDSDMG